MSEEEQEEQFDLKQSIEKYGQFYPIIKSQYGIVDGFHRKLAGGSEVKEIQVNSRLEHWLLRAH
ncbi:MAG: hypothetical protein DRI61_03275 [Chloroflexi bacterium]|nr:MAG: hypothetical protein DRI61_03275 [Chloroflexota bacterium]